MSQENVKLKAEVNKFVARMFYNKEHTPEVLALSYYLLDDVIKFVEQTQVKIGQEMLDNNYDEVYLQDRGIKVYLDEDLECILIDSISEAEKLRLLDKRNKVYTEGLNGNK